jgi:glucokinase
MTVLAVDVGGTKLAVALVTQDGRIVAKTQQATSRSGPDSVLEQIHSMSQTLFDGHGLQAVGLSVPAVLEHGTDRILWAPNLPGWESLDFKAALQERFGVQAVVEYDGHAAVLGEWWCGAGKGYQSVCTIIIGTGIGGGFIVQGKLLRGRDRLAGAVGWLAMQGPDGLAHWEDLASGPGLTRRAQQLIGQAHPTSLQTAGLSARHIFDAARMGDPLARQVIAETAELIGQGIGAVISFANPEIVVLGGSIGQQEDQILAKVQASARRWTQPYAARELPIVCSTLGEEAGLLGVAYSAFQATQH